MHNTSNPSVRTNILETPVEIPLFFLSEDAM